MPDTSFIQPLSEFIDVKIDTPKIDLQELFIYNFNTFISIFVVSFAIITCVIFFLSKSTMMNVSLEVGLILVYMTIFSLFMYSTTQNYQWNKSFIVFVAFFVLYAVLLLIYGGMTSYVVGIAGVIGILSFVLSILMYIETKNRSWMVAMILFSLIIVGFLIFTFYADFSMILKYIRASFFLDTMDNIKMLLDCVKNNIGIVIGLFALSTVLFYSAYDSKALTSRTSTYALFIIAILIGMFTVFSSLLQFYGSSQFPIIIGGGILILLSIVIHYSSYFTPGVITHISNALRGIVLLMIIVGLAIGFKLFSEQIKKMKGWNGFLVNLLFYIPCLLSDGLEYILHQYNITPNIVFILLMIEVVLALSYFYLPLIIKKFIKKSAINLQNKPVFLNKAHNVGNTELFLFKPLNDTTYINNPDIYRRNYCISMWTFLNIQSASDAAYANETNIFNYGNGHPRITYKITSDNKRVDDEGIYTIYFSNTDSKANYQISMPNQKWNFIALNYFASKVDLYVNGNLERTYYFTNNVPEYSPSDQVILGSDNGLNGAICNVNYHKNLLTSDQIATLYNMNYLKNPPVDFIE